MKYKIKDLRTEDAISNLITTQLGKTPQSITLSVMVDVSEVEFDPPLTIAEEKQLYVILAQLDKRINVKVDKP